MAFRANEEIQRGRQDAMSKLLGRSVPPSEMENSEAVLSHLIAAHGPVVEAYPYWHPLVADNDERHSPITRPGRDCGYEGLDHTVFLRNGFITCPYSDGKAVIESVERLAERDPTRGIATISAEIIEAKLYHAHTTAVFVKCEWNRPLDRDLTIPAALAVPLLLERELRAWRESQVAETWKTMAPYILGRPNGSRSSLFVNEATGQTLKTVWATLINTGMFGPIHVGSW